MVESINQALAADEIAPKMPDSIAATVDAMFSRMSERPDDSRDYLSDMFKFNATTNRLRCMDGQEAAERRAWEEGYTELEPFNAFFIRAGAVTTALAGLAISAAIYVGKHRFKHAK